MPFIKTDATYYGPKAKYIEVYANCTPYNGNAHLYAGVYLVRGTTGRIVVHNKVVGINGHMDFRNNIRIYPTDERGTYYVKVEWYSASGKLLYSAKKTIYLVK